MFFMLVLHASLIKKKKEKWIFFFKEKHKTNLEIATTQTRVINLQRRDKYLIHSNDCSNLLNGSKRLQTLRNIVRKLWTVQRLFPGSQEEKGTQSEHLGITEDLNSAGGW